MWQIIVVVTHFCMGTTSECVFSNHGTSREWRSESECHYAIPSNEKRIRAIAKLYEIELSEIQSDCKRVADQMASN